MWVTTTSSWKVHFEDIHGLLGGVDDYKRPGSGVEWEDKDLVVGEACQMGFTSARITKLVRQRVGRGDSQQADATHLGRTTVGQQCLATPSSGVAPPSSWVLLLVDGAAATDLNRHRSMQPTPSSPHPIARSSSSPPRRSTVTPRERLVSIDTPPFMDTGTAHSTSLGSREIGVDEG
ncbi:hypothetical protein E2562_020326 [Oryza meyeriana var. granulata]|uniref:Uncharacterized protein n=1 Tax=Oryza meyeriana var. granulata TaxID=110450 RepID=A0A6G1EBM7_9ORYZ|nr:hypothetical protein E2562_020326 [Oryza meyeriana var. granulata]